MKLKPEYSETLLKALFLVDSVGVDFAKACIECRVDPNDLLQLLCSLEFYRTDTSLQEPNEALSQVPIQKSKSRPIKSRRV
jgi:hypothetical protein